MLWLPQCFRYSIEAKRVESIRTGSDRSLHGKFTCVLTVLQCLKEWKEKKKEWKEKYGKIRRSGNIEDKMFVVFGIFLNQSEKERKLMATNY